MATSDFGLGYNPAFSWSALLTVLESCYLRIPKEA
jgi:hypothetical protein